MARVGANTHGPSYTSAIVVEQPNKSLKKETMEHADTENSAAIPAAKQRVSKEQRKTGKIGG